MIPVPTPLDKYYTRVRPIPSWVPIMQVPAGIEVPRVFMGTVDF